MNLLQWEDQMDVRDYASTVQHNHLVLFLVNGTCSKQVKIMDFFFLVGLLSGNLFSINDRDMLTTLRLFIVG